MVRPPQYVPTLTEVIELQTDVAPIGKTDFNAPISSGFPNPIEDWSTVAQVIMPIAQAPESELEAFRLQADELLSSQAPALQEDAFSEVDIAQKVLNDVQGQIDGLLDFRLREALGPILARHSEALVRDLREELGRTMRDVVARSVSQELAKLRRR